MATRKRIAAKQRTTKAKPKTMTFAPWKGRDGKMHGPHTIDLPIKSRAKKALDNIEKTEAKQRKPKVDKKALRIMSKIESRVRQFQDHVKGLSTKAPNIRVTHAKELLTIVKMMRDAEAAGWID